MALAWTGDLLNRQSRADFLTSYLDQGGCRVLNVDSPWGSGKTFFLKNWRLQLMDSRPVVYFNAWENDFLNDPLLSLVANIRDQLEEYKSEEAAFVDKIKDFTRKAGALARAVAPSLAKGLLKKHFGDDFVDCLDGEGIGDVAEKFVENVLETNKEALFAVKQFQSSLSELFSMVSGACDGRPVFIFIDELDRCRPTYAIELLERVKHFFDIQGARFVVATDTDQLAHSITAVYGGGFASKRYLKRFFDATFVLNNSELDDWIVTHLGVQIIPDIHHVQIYRNYNSSARYGTLPMVTPARNSLFTGVLNQQQLLFKALARTFKTQLRELEGVVKRVGAYNIYFGASNWDFIFAAYLVFLVDSDIDVPRDISTIYGNKEFWDSLGSKYPPVDALYFGSSNESVHTLARYYFHAISEKDRTKRRELEHSQGIGGEIAIQVSGRESDYLRYLDIAFLSAQIS